MPRCFFYCNEMKVITVEIPSGNMWFKTPVHLVRWIQLQEDAVRSLPNKL